MLIPGEKMLMSAEFKRCITRLIYFLDLFFWPSFIIVKYA